MKVTISLTSEELIKILEEKYPGTKIDYIWFTLSDTKEHWESVHKDARLSEQRKKPDDLKNMVLRIYNDGSFDEDTRA